MTNMPARKTRKSISDTGLTGQSSANMPPLCASNAMIVQPTTAMPRDPTTIGARPTATSIGPLRQSRSMMPMMTRLTRLLPKASPAAKSGWSTRRIELTPVTSSGRESGRCQHNDADERPAQPRPVPL